MDNMFNETSSQSAFTPNQNHETSSESASAPKQNNEASSESACTPKQNHETKQDQNQQADMNSPSSVSVIRKTSTPDRLKVPKPFKFPERYTSPTDLMVSPVSKGLIARSRKTGPLLPPSNSQNKVCLN